MTTNQNDVRIKKRITGAVVKEVDGPRVIVEADNKSYFLQGINRPKDVKVGDEGQLLYITAPSSGLWFFEVTDVETKEMG